MELLKYGRNVKVVAPKSLVATMKDRIAEMEDLYK
jgi:predicted DNA-binding transcriptional regulator YafY